MAAPVDRVKLLKIESPSSGGTDDDEGFPATLDPNEDAPSVRGVYIQGESGEDELVYITRDAPGNLVFRDVVQGAEFTLTELLAGATGLPAAEQVGEVLVSQDGSTFIKAVPIFDSDGATLQEDGEQIFEG